MNCQRNVNSILPTQLPHKFSYIVAILTHNHFESPNMYYRGGYESKISLDDAPSSQTIHLFLTIFSALDKTKVHIYLIF
jgi:hypothetical protein